MRFFSAPFALVLLLTSGCGYVHFGRLPEVTPIDATLNTAYSNLSTDYKILKQELALVRKEGDALRAVIDGRGAANPTSDLVAKLNETTRELAALRTRYAQLSETKAPSAAVAAQAAQLEEKLAGSLRNYTQLQEENARLRTEIDRTRTENTALTAQVKSVTAQNEQAQAALAQLNTELLAQKDARARAEQQAAATAAQLSAVIAGAPSKPATLADARESSARASTALAVPTEGAATAELRTNPARVDAAAAPAEAPRLHVVT
ncbi:MAG: hypothetical protein NTV51_19465, partial [Verrucomicrobia bacterium]|nr:hypothetical protein [Verrucomicrobiota bacterium]